MERDTNPYVTPNEVTQLESLPLRSSNYRGPTMYFAVAGIAGAVLAIPLIVPRSIHVRDDPNAIGYLIIILSFPVGGLIYRIRSRDWPIDETVRRRQLIACAATLLLPFSVAILTGMRAQGFLMAVVSGFISMILMVAIFLSGRRRGRFLR
ncbi:MAG: hypothetical protein AAGG48_27510 [Planctomycetota bacterium]